MVGHPPMASETKLPLAQNVLPFDRFWTWIQTHPNCIVAAGTPETMIYDAEDYHWHFGAEEDGTLLVQVLRGKNIVAEILLSSRQVTYVQGERKGEEEYVFECVVETDREPVVAYHFTLTHDYSPEETAKKGRWVH